MRIPTRLEGPTLRRRTGLLAAGLLLLLLVS
jgi:hypothetical protein